MVAGGGLGASLRFAVSVLIARSLGSGYPWATTVVNLVGSLSFGVLWVVLEARDDLSAAWKLFLLTGALGALTTFSTFAFESAQLLSQGRAMTAIFNVLLQNVLAIAAVFLGMGLARALGAD